MKYFSPLIFIGFLSLIISCNKNEAKPEPTGNPFSINGTEFETLQQAIDAASDIDDAEIILTRDATGEGATLRNGTAIGPSINFQSFKYTLKPGCTLLTEDNYLVLTAEDGSLLSSDGTPVLTVIDSGEIVLSGSLSIVADKVISAKNSFIYTHNFSGELEGNIVLDGSKFFLYDNECSIKINSLEVVGNDASFVIDTKNENSNKSVLIKKVISNLKYPVSSIKEGVVSVNDGNVHIHNMTTSIVNHTCTTSGGIESTCSECGYQSFENIDSLGLCPEKDLVFHPKTAATELKCGNIEYWECPHCHKIYKDQNATEELTEGTLILSESYALGETILNNHDNYLTLDREFGDSTNSTAALVIGICSFINGFGGTIWKLLESPGQSTRWVTLFNEIDKIKAQLAEVDRKITLIDQKIEQIPYKLDISKRNKVYCALKYQTFLTDSMISLYLKDTLVPKDTTAKKIKTLIEDWGNCTYEGVSYIDWAKSLTQNYHTGVLGKNYPLMLSDYVNGLCVWEHLGYDFRYQILLKDIAFISKAWSMTQMYYSDIKKYKNPDYRTIDTLNLRKISKDYTADCQTEVNRMHDRKGKYRRLNPYNANFDIIESGGYGPMFDEWFIRFRDKRYPRDNDHNWAVQSCDEMINYHFEKSRGSKYLTQPQAKFIYDYHNKNKQKKVSIYKLLRDSLGFKNVSESASTKDGYILYTQDDGGFTHINGDSALPKYRIWSWEVYKGSKYSDCFSIHTCLRDDASLYTDKIRYECSIRTYGKRKGLFIDLGYSTHHKYTTIFEAKEP